MYDRQQLLTETLLLNAKQPRGVVNQAREKGVIV